ncbi:PAQR family membrane homeostasis protein TrhA [Clostridium sp. Marseille-P299]|uniref:PAQR family membrane homeostasis protein TrhA n=1 Tax=Clostridium sp. Marseille-P299 TaxID=1805477 RepID=UPI0008360EF8|nr:hemolysin III family protein [Clostridium sp. Marseille-P299]
MIHDSSNTKKVSNNETFHFKDPGSAITHLIAVILAVFAAPPLIIKAFHLGGTLQGISMILFMAGVILLYTASTVYHSFDISEQTNTRLRKIDHMMIYVLIAGSYSPICLVALGNKTGIVLFAIIWSFAIIGCFQSLFFIHCPKWVSAAIYIIMGWLCILALPQILQALPAKAFGWLLAGGIIYTVGGVIYALKLPLFNNKHKNFGSHEIFHLFCIGGSLCHYIMMYVYIASM